MPLQVGTALFVAPEVMHNFKSARYDGAAADVWSSGIVLFILLFGRHPFLKHVSGAAGQWVAHAHCTVECKLHRCAPLGCSVRVCSTSLIFLTAASTVGTHALDTALGMPSTLSMVS